MQTTDRIPAARAVPRDDWRIVYEWFAGWRWEQRRGGELVDECLASFETFEECRADVQRRRVGSRAQTARTPSAEQHDLKRLAA